MSTGRIITITCAIGATAGAGYALHRYVRNGQRKDNATQTAAEPQQGQSEAKASPNTPATDAPATNASATSAQPPAEQPQTTQKAQLILPMRMNLKTRINRSTHTNGKVDQSPDELLAQARKHDRHVTLDELTGARLAASEHGRGSPTEHACIVDSELNRAARRDKTLHDSVTRGHGFGKQGRERPASTRLDARICHLLASRAVLSGDARGIANGAIRFFDPYTMNIQNKRYRDWEAGGRVGKKPAIVSCDALTLLEAWSFDYGKKGGNRCPPDRSRHGRNPLAWVGPIPGVDPLRLMLMKPMPIGPEHQRQYQAAREVLQRGL